MSLLELSGVTASYGASQALFGVDLAIGEGLVTPVTIATATYVLHPDDIATGSVTNTAEAIATAVATAAGGDPDPAAPLGVAGAVTDDSDTGTDTTAVDPTNGDTVDIPDPAGTGGPDDPTVLTLNTVDPSIELI